VTIGRATTSRRPTTSSISKRRAAALGRGDERYTRRRAEIVASARIVFRDKGFQDSTIADVAAAVGVGRATLYFYVSGKQEIFDEIVIDIAADQLSLAQGILASTETGSVKLRMLITCLMRSLEGNYPFLHTAAQEEITGAKDSARSGVTGLRSISIRYERVVETILQQGVDDGTLRADLATRVITAGLLGMICWPHRWLTPEAMATNPAAAGEVYADILLHGLAAADPEVDAPPGLPAPHQDVVDLLARFATVDIPTYDTLGVDQARSQLDAVVRLQRPPVSVDSVEDVSIDSPTGRVPARIYRPAAAGALPVVVYLHGGGWVLGNLEVADRPCRALAAEAPCVLVSVDYRLAPETKFPGALEDCVEAVRWVADQAESWGGSDRLVIVGDSAGGNLAAATSTVLRDEGGPTVAAQVLIYPTLAPPSTTDYASYRTFADGPLMTRRELEWFWQHYLRGPQDATDPLAAPLHASDLTGLPPTTIFVAQLDPLHDEGVAYAEKLGAAGIAAELVVIEGAAHGFWWMDKVMSQAAGLTTAVARIVRPTPEEIPR